MKQSSYFSVSMTPKQLPLLCPGDLFTETFWIKNISSAALSVRLYQVEPEDPSLLYPVILASLDRTANESEFLPLSQLTSGWYHLEAGETLPLEIQFYFPKELGNEYQGASLSASVLFECRGFTEESAKIHIQTSDKQETASSLEVSAVPHTADISAPGSYLLILFVLLGLFFRIERKINR